MGRSRWTAIARGDEPPDLVLAGGEVLSVFTGEVFSANVAIADGHIVGVGQYCGPETHDVSGMVLIPGFIDGHCHIESSKLSVEEFAKTVLSRGTTSVIVDPHELANVLGPPGIQYVLDASEGLPLDVFVMMPSCVPASPFESPLVPIGAPGFFEFQNHPRVIGIAEMMDFPGAIAGNSNVLAKMATTNFSHIDGHAPNVSGRELNAYLVAGPSSDHECITFGEALEKRRLGMWIMLREATMIRNLLDLLPLIDQYGTENCMFVTDDREAGTLLSEGHINSMVHKAVAWGLLPGDAVKLATLNVARYHGLAHTGAIAPGYSADILVVPDLRDFEPVAVYKRGRLVAKDGELLDTTPDKKVNLVSDTVHVRPVSSADFRVPHRSESQIRIVKLVPDQVVTVAVEDSPTVVNGLICSDIQRDLLKTAVVERHHATGRIGVGFVRGFGLREGAFASTVAHDAHNIVVAGVNDDDMAACVSRLAEIGGGLVVINQGHLIGELRLEIAGLMSSLAAAKVAKAIQTLEESLARLGVTMRSPFMYLGFLALSVIPELRITDQGIVDVRSFKIVPLGHS
ncbi:MAG: adenine deaminase [Chloroflexota bacterium]